MIDDLAPLVPSDVDLRDFAFMPLEIRRLFSSETWVLGSYEEKCASLCLWGESWFQVPAASLPNNDRMLSHLSQTGSRWSRVKEHAMRGWVLCSDGRWYHPVVAEKALEAWAKHKKASSKGKAGAAKRWGTGNSTTNSTGINQLMPADSNRTDIGTDKDKKPLSADDDPDFMVFWKSYPNKASRQKAWLAYRKLNPDESLGATMLAALGVQKLSEKWREADGKYIPHAATWISGRRWEDQLGPNPQENVI